MFAQTSKIASTYLRHVARTKHFNLMKHVILSTQTASLNQHD